MYSQTEEVPGNKEAPGETNSEGHVSALGREDVLADIVSQEIEQSCSAEHSFPSGPACGRSRCGGINPPSKLSAEHRQHLRRSALTDQQIDAIGCWSDRDGRLHIPYLKPDGRPEVCHDGRPFARFRLSGAEIAANPKGGKYRSPAGEGCRVYHSALAIKAGNYHHRLKDPHAPIRITEGEWKAEACSVHDPQRITIGLGGVSSWVDRYDGQAKDQQSRPIVELEEIAWANREVRICFDSDLHKPQVRAALEGLARWLDKEGAYVLIERLPNELDGRRNGADDFIYRHGAESFAQVVKHAHKAFVIKERGTRERVFNLPTEPESAHGRGLLVVLLAGRDWRQSSNGERFWHQWTGTHWVERPNHDAVDSMLEKLCNSQGWSRRETGIIRDMRGSLRRSVGPLVPAPAPGLVPFQNGCLRLSDGGLVPHDPEHGNRWCLPFPWQPAADGVAVDEWLLDRLGDADSLALFRAFVRALVIGERPKAFLELIGPSNSGKSVATNLARAAVGIDNTASSTLERLEDKSQRFETAKFQNKRLVLFGEAGGYSGPLEVLKQMTGGDAISAETKGSTAPADYTFTGGVIITTNQAIRPSDRSGAVINRRRSLYLAKVVAASDERSIFEPDGRGGWKGELATAMPGWIASLIQMDEQAARRALARDVGSPHRMEQELQTLTETDPLAAWADEHLVWDEQAEPASVGSKDCDRRRCLFPHYRDAVEGQGGYSLSARNFKQKLTDLLRDTLGLPLPPGSINTGSYRIRSRGSVLPMVRLRRADDGDAPGVIRYAMQRRILPGLEQMEPQQGTDGTDGTDWNGFSELTKAERMGTDAERVKPSGGTDGTDGTDLSTPHVGEEREGFLRIGACGSQSVPSVPPSHSKGSQPRPSVPHPFRIRSAPPDLVEPVEEAGPTQPSSPLDRFRKQAPPAETEPAPPEPATRTTTGWVKLALEHLNLAPHPSFEREVHDWLEQHPAKPGCSRTAIALALQALQREEQAGEDTLPLLDGWDAA